MVTFLSDNPSSCGIVDIDQNQVLIDFNEKPANPKSSLANAAISVQFIGKGDSAKWGQLDAASTSYNVVVLGAALIAHELGLGEVVGVTDADVEMASFDANDGVGKGKAENDEEQR